jgi:regulator of PEP synthase PpsR (kinase-PPPase family)
MQTVFYISDGTAITAEVFGHALLSQFPVEFDQRTYPFIETEQKARFVTEKINDLAASTGHKPLVFHSIVSPEIRTIIESSQGHLHDFLSTFVSPLSKQLNLTAEPQTHRTHSIKSEAYDARIEAVNYAMANDDGISCKDYDAADLILVGVSRSGKTPTSLYLALQFGIKTANYPFIAEDMDDLSLPPALKRNKHKLFGLTIDAVRLQEIRGGRLANSNYASQRQCKLEIKEVEYLYRREKIPFINSTTFSVEEMATKILDKKGLKRRIF